MFGEYPDLPPNFIAFLHKQTSLKCLKKIQEELSEKIEVLPNIEWDRVIRLFEVWKKN
jgi:hypothetical protein